MEHELTIASSPGAGIESCDEPLHVMARMNLGSFENEGYPESIEGKLLAVPARLARQAAAGRAVRADLGGQLYMFTHLRSDGSFRLSKDHQQAGLVCTGEWAS